MLWPAANGLQLCSLGTVRFYEHKPKGSFSQGYGLAVCQFRFVLWGLQEGRDGRGLKA